VSKAFTASLAELPESRQRAELQVPPLARQPHVMVSGCPQSVGLPGLPAQADTARFVSLLYTKLRDGTQHATPPARQRPSKRRRTAAADRPPADRAAAPEEDIDAVLSLLLDSEYDATVSQVRGVIMGR